MHLQLENCLKELRYLNIDDIANKKKKKCIQIFLKEGGAGLVWIYTS